MEGAIGLSKFRLDSLACSLYKVLAIVLANMLEVLLTITSKFQGAFVKGKQILDDIIIANESIASRERAREPGLLCKDPEKDYDCMDWSYLIYVLHRFGFGSNWISWMKECVSTTFFSSIFVNGSPHGFSRMKQAVDKVILYPLSFSQLSRKHCWSISKS